MRSGLGLVEPFTPEVVAGGSVVGQIAPDFHDEVRQLNDLGFELDGHFDHETGVLVLALKAEEA